VASMLPRAAAVDPPDAGPTGLRRDGCRSALGTPAPTPSARLPSHHAQVGIALGAVTLVADGFIPALIGLRSSV
jgi:hypothetical protein